MTFVLLAVWKHVRKIAVRFVVESVHHAPAAQDAPVDVLIRVKKDVMMNVKVAVVAHVKSAAVVNAKDVPAAQDVAADVPDAITTVKDVLDVASFVLVHALPLVVVNVFMNAVTIV